METHSFLTKKMSIKNSQAFQINLLFTHMNVKIEVSSFCEFISPLNIVRIYFVYVHIFQEHEKYYKTYRKIAKFILKRHENPWGNTQERIRHIYTGFQNWFSYFSSFHFIYYLHTMCTLGYTGTLARQIEFFLVKNLIF